jgi:predicted flap endonuclease-1-like 5' DNA nuclease
MPKINRQEELGMETEPMKVKNMLVELEEIKGVGPKTAQKLKAADINHVSDLAISSAKFLSQKTGLSEKSLSNWIEQAKRMHRRTEH